MKALTLLLILSTLVACGKNGQDGASGSDGATIIGLDGVSTGVDFADISPGLVCAAGGISIFTFRDNNSDGLFSDDVEELIKVKALCHGTNGTNGVDGTDGVDGIDGVNGVDGTNGTNASITLEGVVASATCPQGGVKITSSQSPAIEVCNGVNGLNGEQGLPGVQGIPGLAGSNGQNGQNGQDGQNGSNGQDGTQILPVQFCPTDKSTFPEYGLMIGKELFAVYWGTTPASPKTPQAFLTKLVPGKYQSTGGNNCLFSIE